MKLWTLLATAESEASTPFTDIVVIVVLAALLLATFAIVGRAGRRHRPFGGSFGGTSGMGNSRYSAGRGGRFGGGSASGRWK